jgi:hypothetical protein
LTNYVVNGGFETGDLTGWTHTQTGAGIFTCDVIAAGSHSGTYNLHIYARSNPIPPGTIATNTISQDIDFDDVGVLSFWYTFIGDPNPALAIFKVYIGASLVFTRDTMQGAWTQVGIGTSAFTGVNTVQFQSWSIDGGLPGIYLDDIETSRTRGFSITTGTMCFTTPP